MTNVIQIPFHIGDFLSGTMNMDGTEIGAFWLLCVAHYQAGAEGLPDDDRQLARIAKVTSRVWARVRPIVQQKFDIIDGRWTQKRVLEVLQKIANKSAENSANSLKRWNSDNANALPSQSQPKTINHKPIKKEKNIKKEQSFSEGFDQFWEAYPRHRRGNKQKSWEAWRRALTQGRATEAEIIRGAKSYAASNPGEFAKGAEAWLNDDRWTWQATDAGVRLSEEKDDWPPWKHDFAQIMGEKAVFSWLKGAEYGDGVLIVAQSFQAQRIREEYSDRLQRIGVKIIKTKGEA